MGSPACDGKCICTRKKGERVCYSTRTCHNGEAYTRIQRRPVRLQREITSTAAVQHSCARTRQTK